jgi:hypothetical protein
LEPIYIFVGKLWWCILFVGGIFFSGPPWLLVSLTSMTSDSMAVARSCGYITTRARSLLIAISCITCFHSCGGFVNSFESRFDVSPSCVGVYCHLFVACVCGCLPTCVGTTCRFVLRFFF